MPGYWIVLPAQAICVRHMNQCTVPKAALNIISSLLTAPTSRSEASNDINIWMISTSSQLQNGKDSLIYWKIQNKIYRNGKINTPSIKMKEKPQISKLWPPLLQKPPKKKLRLKKILLLKSPITKQARETD